MLCFKCIGKNTCKWIHIMSNDGLMQNITWPAHCKNIQVLYDHISGDIKIPTYDVITFCILYWCELLFVLYFKDGWSWSALMLASKNGHTETVKCLIGAKAQLDLQTNASIIYRVARYILILKHESFYDILRKVHWQNSRQIKCGGNHFYRVTRVKSVH